MCEGSGGPMCLCICMARKELSGVGSLFSSYRWVRKETLGHHSWWQARWTLSLALLEFSRCLLHGSLQTVFSCESYCGHACLCSFLFLQGLSVLLNSLTHNTSFNHSFLFIHPFSYLFLKIVHIFKMVCECQCVFVCVYVRACVHSCMRA